jgi:hypothetical protein
MDTARLAEMADPAKNRRFRGPWVDPPRNRKRPGAAPPAPRARSESITDNVDNIRAALAGQQAVSFALRRAASLDRLADLLLSIGRHTAAERLAHLAAELREVAA